MVDAYGKLPPIDMNYEYQDRSGKTLLTFAVASEVLKVVRDDDGRTGYPIQVHVVAYDRSTDRTITLDTLRQFSASQGLAPGQFLLRCDR